MKVGDKFGNWEVLSTTGKPFAGKSWCKCQCGTTRYVLNQNLSTRKSVSCGCIRKSEGRAHGLRAQRDIGMDEMYKNNATGYKGVVAVGSYYQVRLAVGGFTSPEAAHECYAFLKDKAREFQDEAFS